MVLRACNLIKKRLQHGCVPVNIPKVLGTAFFIEQPWWLLLNYVLVPENNFLKIKLVERLLIKLFSLFHVQIQEPTSRSSTTTAFVFLAKFAEFYCHKIFETRSQRRPKCLHGLK